jgi:hypothetical protein
MGMASDRPDYLLIALRAVGSGHAFFIREVVANYYAQFSPTQDAFFGQRTACGGEPRRR